MTDAEQIKRDMRLLLDALRLDVGDCQWRSGEHRAAMKLHVGWFIGELSALLIDLEKADALEEKSD